MTFFHGQRSLLTLLGILIGIASVILVSGLLPARRAASLDPIVASRKSWIFSMSPAPGEVRLADLGMAAKTQPGLIVSRRDADPGWNPDVGRKKAQDTQNSADFAPLEPFRGNYRVDYLAPL